MQLFCTDCGKPLASGTRFCGDCGAVVAESSSASTPAPSVAPGQVQQQKKPNVIFAIGYTVMGLILLFWVGLDQFQKGHEIHALVDGVISIVLFYSAWLKWVGKE
jgi:uncharacterized membrane protein YvbJ